MGTKSQKWFDDRREFVPRLLEITAKKGRHCTLAYEAALTLRCQSTIDKPPWHDEYFLKLLTISCDDMTEEEIEFQSAIRYHLNVIESRKYFEEDNLTDDQLEFAVHRYIDLESAFVIDDDFSDDYMVWKMLNDKGILRNKPVLSPALQEKHDQNYANACLIIDSEIKTLL